MANIHNISVRILLLSVILPVLLLNACGPVKDSGKTPQENPEQQAQVFIDNRDYAAAAAEYLRLAKESKNPACLSALAISNRTKSFH